MATTPRQKTAQINLRVVPELKDALERAAAEDARSLTSLLEKLARDHLRDHPPADNPLAPVRKRGSRQ
jgi:hypothetical protein